MVRLAVLLLLAGVANAQAPPSEQVPFPFKKSTILREQRTTYYVEGRLKIPRGCEISVQKEVYIVGRGKDAVIEVEGSLQIHGVSEREVILIGVWIEPSKNCEDIHLDMTKFRGSGGVRAPKQLQSKAKIFIENCHFEAGTRLDVSLIGGRIDVGASALNDPTSIVGLTDEKQLYSNLVVNLRGCVQPYAGFWGGLFVEGSKDVTCRLNQMGGAKSHFKDNLKLTFDGNKVQSGLLTFEHTQSGRFSKTKLQKSDIYASKVVFKCPAGKKERVSIDKCWFKGLAKEKEILEKVIKTENELSVKFGKINKRALELAGALER